MEGQASEERAKKDVYDDSKASKFQFKKSSKRRHRDKEGDSERRSFGLHHSDADKGSRRSHRDSRRRRKHKHRSSEHHHRCTRNGEYDNPDHRYRESIYDGVGHERIGSLEADPDEAFRESLFDALADDEGAAYWEGVYGQPIHVYSDTKAGPNGRLERMTDDEYAEYVRTKMWEKTHQHIVEEREARERAKKKRKEEQGLLQEENAREEQERERVRRQMEQSLRRGEERKRAKEAEAAWARYVKEWEDLKNTNLAQETERRAQDAIPWPVSSGKWKHVEKDEIEHFLKNSTAWREDAIALLKLERVRWHPDKMQQRFGQHLEPNTMRLVTAVFQVIDRLWNERRK